MFQITWAQLWLRLNSYLQTTMNGYACTCSSMVSNNWWIWCSFLTNYMINTKVCHAGWCVWSMSVTTNKTCSVYILYQMIKPLFYWTELNMNWNWTEVSNLKHIYCKTCSSQKSEFEVTLRFQPKLVCFDWTCPY